MAEGQHFKCADGTPFTGIETTDFQLYQRYLNGEDLTPILAQRRDVGVNMLRVLGMCAGMFHFFPQEQPLYYTDLPKFAKLLEGYGVYLDLVAFADATVAMPDRIDQLGHWAALGSVLAGVTNVLVSAVNEADQPINRLVTLAELQPLSGILCSHGSNGSQAIPPSPYFACTELHTNGAPEEQRKPHNAMELGNLPVWVSETSRFPDVGMWVGTDWTRVKNLAYDMGACAALLCAGICGHTVNGKFSRLWDVGEEWMMRALVAGCKSVDLSFQNQPYRHSVDEIAREQANGFLRCYRRGDSPFVDIRR